MAKRIGIISDTHGLLRPEVISILKTCDCILHAGDVDRPEILDQLRYLGSLYVVRGNNDRDWAEKLSVTLRFKIEGTEFFMTHNKKDVAWDLGTAQVVIFGHSHHYFEKMIDGRLWLNPGSCGRSRFGGDVTMALMEIDNGNWNVRKINFLFPRTPPRPEGFEPFGTSLAKKHAGRNVSVSPGAPFRVRRRTRGRRWWPHRTGFWTHSSSGRPG